MCAWGFLCNVFIPWGVSHRAVGLNFSVTFSVHSFLLLPPETQLVIWTLIRLQYSWLTVVLFCSLSSAGLRPLQTYQESPVVSRLCYSSNSSQGQPVSSSLADHKVHLSDACVKVCTAAHSIMPDQSFPIFCFFLSNSTYFTLEKGGRQTWCFPMRQWLH